MIGKLTLFLLLCLSLCGTDTTAQTTVTTSGATTNIIPLFTGSSTLGNSVIWQSGGNVGIGTTTPASALDVNGSAIIRTAGNSETWSMQPGHNGYGPSLRSFNASSYTQGQIESSYLILNGETGGNVGIGVTNPQAAFHLSGTNAAFATNGQAFGNGNAIIGATGNRSTSAGPAVTFAMAANTDGSNVWEQGRIIATADNTNNADASGRLSLQTRYLAGSTWSWRNNLVLTSNGNVGVGTLSPGAPLEVNGSMKLTSGSGASITFPDSTVQSTAWNGTTLGGDYAESVDVATNADGYEPGDIIVIDPDVHGNFLKSTEPYSTMVAGIYSTKPGLLGRRQGVAQASESATIPMALVGIVPTKVSTENGPIKDGDLLVTSSTPGVAMKGTDAARLTGAVVGKALNRLDTGSGVIEVLIRVQ